MRAYGVEDRLYTKLSITSEDMDIVIACLDDLSQRSLFGDFSDRPLAEQKAQSIVLTAAVVSYVRPFTRSRGLPQLPNDLVVRDPAQQRLHDWLRQMRHSFFAHSDAALHQRFRTQVRRGLSVSIEAVHKTWLTEREGARLREMATALNSACQKRIDELPVQIDHAIMDDEAVEHLLKATWSTSALKFPPT